MCMHTQTRTHARTHARTHIHTHVCHKTLSLSAASSVCCSLFQYNVGKKVLLAHTNTHARTHAHTYTHIYVIRLLIMTFILYAKLRNYYSSKLEVIHSSENKITL